MANIIQHRFGSLAAPIKWGSGNLEIGREVADPFNEKVGDDFEANLFSFLSETIGDFLGIDQDEIIVDDACPKDMVIHPYRLRIDL